MMLQHPEYKINLDRTCLEVVNDKDAVLDLLGDWEVEKLFTQGSFDGSYQNLRIAANNELNDKLNEILNELRENKNFDVYKREIVNIWQRFLNEESEVSVVTVKSENAKDRRWMSRHCVEAHCGDFELWAQVGDEPVTETQEAIATFQENAVESTETIETTGLDSVAYAVSLEKFILRPYLYYTINWDSTLAPFTNLLQISLPNDLLANVPTLKSKINNFAFWRPSFEITLRVNGTMMHYGRIIAYWLPQAVGLGACYKNTISGFTGNFIQVDANGSNVAKLVIPYTHYQDRINVGHVDVDVATLFIDVASVLSSIGGTPASINVGVFVRITEHNLTGYAYANDWVAQMGEMKAQMYSEVVRKGRDFAGTVMNVTSLNAYVPPMKRLAGIALNVLDFLGLSNPINLSVTNSMQIRQPLFMHGVDTPNSINMATDMASTVSKDLSYVNSFPAETDIVTFCSRVGLLRLGTITSLQPNGTILESIVLNPMNLVHENYLGPFSLTAYNPMPVCYIAKMFAMWRGSFKFTLSFIKSNFHNARIRISYIPYESSVSVFGTFGVLAENDVESIVVDLSSQSEVTFIIPYQQKNDWAWNTTRVRDVTQAQVQDYSNGRLVISIINELTSGTVPVTPIYYQLFVSACEDLQFSQPSMLGVRDSGFQAQIGEMIGNGECTFQACSSDNLRMVKGKILGNDIAHISNNATTTTTTGSLLNMSKMLSACILATFSTHPNVAVSPGSSTNLRGYQTYSNYTLFIQSVFRYWKGGMRFAMFPQQTGDSLVTASIIPNTNLAWYTYPIATAPALIEPMDSSTGLVCHNVISRNPVDVILPYNNPQNCLPTSTSSTVSITSLRYPSIVFRTAVNAGGQLFDASILMGGADDYLLGFQLQIPTCNGLSNA